MPQRADAQAGVRDRGKARLTAPVSQGSGAHDDQHGWPVVEMFWQGALPTTARPSAADGLQRPAASGYRDRVRALQKELVRGRFDEGVLESLLLYGLRSIPKLSSAMFGCEQG